jgi:hypothetical protein
LQELGRHLAVDADAGGGVVLQPDVALEDDERARLARAQPLGGPDRLRHAAVEGLRVGRGELQVQVAETAELVKSTQKGILVTRTWYIRMVDPQTVLLTGLTRDGTFYIENGEIKYPVKNFRFNESPVIMLNNIEELGKPVRVAGDESSFVMMIPPMKLRDFTFTSLSDAV